MNSRSCQMCSCQYNSKWNRVCVWLNIDLALSLGRSNRSREDLCNNSEFSIFYPPPISALDGSGEINEI